MEHVLANKLNNTSFDGDGVTNSVKASCERLKEDQGKGQSMRSRVVSGRDYGVHGEAKKSWERNGGQDRGLGFRLEGFYLVGMLWKGNSFGGVALGDDCPVTAEGNNRRDRTERLTTTKLKTKDKTKQETEMLQTAPRMLPFVLSGALRLILPRGYS